MAATTAKTALPIGGRLHVDPAFTGGMKTVDRPNANAKFAKKAPPRSNISTIFSAAEPAVSTPRAGKRCVAPIERKEERPQAKRVSTFERDVAARAIEREQNPRPLRKVAEPPKADKVHAIATAGGVAHSGGKASVAGAGKSNETTLFKAEEPKKEYASMERYRCTPKATGGNVLRPETMPAPVEAPRDQRFAHTPRNTGSLTGVFKTVPLPPRPAYKVTPPFFTADS